jgi:replicative DNA helicase
MDFHQLAESPDRENLPPMPDSPTEVWIISSMLQWPKDSIEQAKSELPSDAFRTPAHKEIVEAIYSRFDAGLPCFHSDILHHFHVTGERWIFDKLTSIMFDLPQGWSTTRLDDPRRIARLKHNYDSYALWIATSKAKKMFERGEISKEEYVEQLQIATLSESKSRSATMTIKDAAGAAIDELEEIIKLKGALRGVPTGLESLNKVTSGWRGGQLIILAARPSIGKSALAVNMAVSAARSGKHACIFTLEMTAAELSVRMICGMAKVGMDEVMQGEMSKHHLNSYANAHRQVLELPITIDETSAISISSLRARARAIHEKKPLDLILVDYLQLCTGTTKRAMQNRHLEVAEISGGLKSLAKELNVPVIALSQLNRQLEQRKDARPMLSDLRESGSIEQDADIVLLLHRKKEKPSEDAELFVAKNRSGQAGVGIRLWFDGPTTTFTDHQ